MPLIELRENGRGNKIIQFLEDLYMYHLIEQRISGLRYLMIATLAIHPYTHSAAPLLFDRARAFEKFVHLSVCAILPYMVCNIIYSEV